MVVLVDFSLPYVRKVDFPEIDLSVIGSASQKASGVDRKGVNMLVSGALSELFWPQFHPEELCLLSILALR